MSERGYLLSAKQRPSAGLEGPHEDILSAISELADHVRASNLRHADDLLTELLVLLHTRKQD
ncbi:hypothetical protein [Muricoccus vinaceus]|uniref:Uncharacterized protein n=1 Tax=Muricoccus vinaceus TaxID=424704 RepID=A0ABV6INE1_9PROT